jgi:hypothetical protein
MESTSRLYLCLFCHQQVIICRKCDRGNIYCGPTCATLARIKSLQLAGARYQATVNGKRHHAARQARYLMNHSTKMTHQTSPVAPSHASIQLAENKSEKSENEQRNTALICHFCKKPASVWFRNDFLRRRGSKKSTELKACPQAP